LEGQKNKDRFTYMLMIIFVAFVTIFLSTRYGFLSPDSYKYLSLADGVKTLEGCVIDGGYFATFPCGYPLFIAALSSLFSIETFFASKILNVVFYISSFFLLSHFLSRPWLAAVILINPVVLQMVQMTWSENMFLFSLSGVLFSIKTSRDRKGGYGLFCLFVFICLGFLSRYIFAPLAFLIFIYIYYSDSRLAYKLFPSFIMSGLVFIGLITFNYYKTGYITGQERLPAIESFEYLFLVFLLALFVVALCLVFLIFVWQFILTKDVLKKSTYENKLLLWVGISYLGLIFFFRLQSQFDLFNFRLIGLGGVFIYGYFVAYYFSVKTVSAQKKSAVIIVIFMLSILFSAPERYVFNWSSLDVSYKESLDAYDKYLARESIVIKLNEDPVSVVVSADDLIKYGAKAKVIRLNTLPYNKAESFSEFKSRLSGYQRRLGYQSCWVDFKSVGSKEELRQILSRRVNVTIDSKGFSSLLAHDESMVDFFNQVYQGQESLPCDAFL